MKKKNNKRTFFDDFNDFEDYDEYDEYADYTDDDVETEEKFHNYATTKDFSDVSYDDFNKVIDPDDEEEYDEAEYIEEDEEDEDNGDKEVRVVRKRTIRDDDTDLVNAQLFVILNNFWFVFRVIGIAIAVVLFFYFLIEGRLVDLFSYLFLLAGAFLFGFCFMYFVNKLMDSK